MLTPRTLSWQRSGKLVEFDGRGIFVRERGGDGPPLLLLHGYPSSSYDWRHMFERRPSRRLASFDFLGFGLSDKPRDQVYSLHMQADLVEAVAGRCFPGQPLLVVAHDMGTSVTTELLARENEGRLGFELAGVLLLNGSIVIEKASLTVSQKLLRSRLGRVAAKLSNERGFRAQFGRLFSDEHPLSPEEAADQWSLVTYNAGHRILDRLTFYLHERVAYADRWHSALRTWPGRLELAWALRDPVSTEAVLEAVIELRPDVDVTRLPELGHYPQLEDPSRVAAIVDAFADGRG